MAAAAARADQWLDQRAARRKPDEQLTVVFDLDETLLSGMPYMTEFDFGWSEATWQTWVDAARAAPIIPIREVYRHARRLGMDVIFLTARPEHQRDSTIKNLVSIDCADYAELICQPDAVKARAALFKAGERKRLTESGRVIIATIGDQESDLEGGFAEQRFKLPNPFYLSP
jgi:predicted secreted acid phosphatase